MLLIFGLIFSLSVFFVPDSILEKYGIWRMPAYILGSLFIDLFSLLDAIEKSGEPDKESKEELMVKKILEDEEKGKLKD